MIFKSSVLNEDKPNNNRRILGERLFGIHVISKLFDPINHCYEILQNIPYIDMAYYSTRQKNSILK